MGFGVEGVQDFGFGGFAFYVLRACFLFRVWGPRGFRVFRVKVQLGSSWSKYIYENISEDTGGFKLEKNEL